METRNACRRKATRRQFLPYLWGMETSFFASSSASSFGSYRTYEEWKQKKYAHDILVPFLVLTVPMRNGNDFLICLLPKACWFLPYLWGMETFFFRFSSLVLIASFLPYLWGMETHTNIPSTIFATSSYHTYEEWKLHKYKRFQIIN